MFKPKHKDVLVYKYVLFFKDLGHCTPFISIPDPCWYSRQRVINAIVLDHPVLQSHLGEITQIQLEYASYL